MPPEDGATRYTDWGCRCEVCRAAHAERHRELRSHRRASGPEDDQSLQHGTKSTYVNYGCRCEPCLEGAAGGEPAPAQRI